MSAGDTALFPFGLLALHHSSTTANRSADTPKRLAVVGSHGDRRREKRISFVGVRRQERGNKLCALKSYYAHLGRMETLHSPLQIIRREVRRNTKKPWGLVGCRLYKGDYYFSDFLSRVASISSTIRVKPSFPNQSFTYLASSPPLMSKMSSTSRTES